MKKELEKYLEKSYSYRKNGWIFLHIEGSPYERGFQHGYHMATQLTKILRMLKHITILYTGKEFSFFVEAAKQLFLPHIDNELIEEMKGITEGAQAGGCCITFDELLAWNGYDELTDYWWPSTLGKKKDGSSIHEKCSAFIATGDATKHKGIIMGHNTWNDYVIGQYYNVILDLVPSDGYRIMMQTAPGYIQSFTDFFITGAGIIGTETTFMGYDKFKEDGAPEFYRARKAMQYGKTVDKWVEIMQENSNGAYANSWLLGDINTNEIVRFEQGLEYSSMKRLRNGYFIGFNAPEDPRIRNLECDYTGYNDVRTNGARRVRWKQLMDDNYGKIDTKLAGEMLADHCDVYRKQEDHPSSRTLCGHSDVDPYEYVGITGPEPFSPKGSVDAKVVSDRMAKNFTLFARFGRSCGEPFEADKFLEKHPQWNWLKGYLEDRPTQPWAMLRAKK